ncbi:acyl carrier protein [Streptomyces sp. GMR22]|uniref:acyl carrier protein n=1 Tax=Streptomyces sp. GMR22 TaxID=2759524 RepID=UPI0015FD8804|nr:phosphopantetheine-binding protein [Streptomyces sp. GMR22]MBA6439097.1 acyl carrier protein [Streptomyces sp. GMR22]
MATEDPFARYEKLLRERIGDTAPERLSPTDRLADLGLDSSLQLVQLIVQIEEEFDIEMPADSLTAENFASVDSLWLVLRDLLYETQQTA